MLCRVSLQSRAQILYRAKVRGKTSNRCSSSHDNVRLVTLADHARGHFLFRSRITFVDVEIRVTHPQ